MKKIMKKRRQKNEMILAKNEKKRNKVGKEWKSYEKAQAKEWNVFHCQGEMKNVVGRNEIAAKQEWNSLGISFHISLGGIEKTVQANAQVLS